VGSNPAGRARQFKGLSKDGPFSLLGASPQIDEEPFSFGGSRHV
jgi:hypothetical protein